MHACLAESIGCMHLVLEHRLMLSKHLQYYYGLTTMHMYGMYICIVVRLRHIDSLFLSHISCLA